jgi:hypothetical protein
MNQNPDHVHLPPGEVSKLIDRAPQTLANDRFLGRGIPYVKIGRLVRYRLSDVLAYCEAHKITPTGE